MSSYRLTPQSSTGASPSSLLFKFTPATRFSRLQPSFASSASRKQTFPDSPSRGFNVGELVWVLNPPSYRPKWIKGTIVSRAGPLTYSVSVSGRERSVHVEHLRSCSSSGSSSVHVPSDSVGMPAAPPQPQLVPQLPVPQRDLTSPQLHSPTSNPVDSPVPVASDSSSVSDCAPASAPPISNPSPVVSTPPRQSVRPARERHAPKRLIEEL